MVIEKILKDKTLLGLARGKIRTVASGKRLDHYHKKIQIGMKQKMRLQELKCTETLLMILNLGV